MRFFLSLFTLALVFSLSSCNTTKTAAAAKAPEAEMTKAPMAPSYAGTWDITVEDTPLGTQTGTMVLTDTDGVLTGTFKMDQGGTMKLKTINTTDSGMSSSFYFPDYDIDVDFQLSGKASADMLIGQSMGQYKMTAKRKM